jgi:hypothetical protein
VRTRGRTLLWFEVGTCIPLHHWTHSCKLATAQLHHGNGVVRLLVMMCWTELHQATLAFVNSSCLAPYTSRQDNKFGLFWSACLGHGPCGICCPLFWAVPVCITINEWAKCNMSILLLWELLVTFWRVGSLWSWPEGSCVQLCPNFAERTCVGNERECVSRLLSSCSTYIWIQLLN